MPDDTTTSFTARPSLAILISGRGSNMVAIAKACQSGELQAIVGLVISNRPNAPGLDAAREMGIETAVIDHRNFPSREAFDWELARKIEEFEPELVVLAGFMRILTAGFVNRFTGRLINIHPSLLPSFTGLDTHRRALEAGVKAHGATVHFVTAELDAGPIIAQAVVPVLDDDDADSLMSRVQRAEHQLYPSAVRWLVSDAVVLDGQVTRLAAEAGSALQFAATFNGASHDQAKGPESV